MAKLGKKARKFARKHLQVAAKRNRKIRNQFNNRRPRRGSCAPVLASLPPTAFLLALAWSDCWCFFLGGSGREDGRPDDGGEDVPHPAEDANM
jgi:hypothetical protein